MFQQVLGWIKEKYNRKQKRDAQVPNNFFYPFDGPVQYY